MEYVDRLEALLASENKKTIENGETMKFGERLEYLRKRAGWSRAEVAHRIKLSPSTVVKHEYGDREPNLTTLKAYAMLYDVSIDYLLGLSDDPSTKISTIVHGWKDNISEAAADKQEWLSEQDITDLKILLRKLRESGIYSANW